MNFLKYKGAEDFLDDTGLTAEQGLQVVENEITKLKQGVTG